jgi:hypothetical protein
MDPDDHESDNEDNYLQVLWSIAPGRAIRKKRTVLIPQIESKQTCKTAACVCEKR